MSTYDQLTGTASRIADLAIEWEMKEMGWWKVSGGEHGGWWMITVGASPAYLLDPTGMYVKVLGEDGPMHNRADFAYTASTDFRAIWRGWYERMHELFSPWQSLPDPAAFQPTLDSLENAISVLNVTTEVEVSGGTGQGAVTEKAELESANADLDSALRSYCGEIIGMAGAMDTFALLYSNRVPTVLRGQIAILGLLGCNASAEQNLFKCLREDIASIADDMYKVMEDQNSGGAAGALSILGAVLAGAGIFFSGGALAPVIANGSAVVSVLSAFVPEDKPDGPAEDKFGADTPMGVYNNVADYLGEVKRIVRGEEQVVKDSLTGALTEVTTNREPYDLSERPTVLDAPPSAFLKADSSTMAFIGGVIGPFISQNMAVCRQQAANSPQRSAWQRNPDIGLGTYGPWTDWDALYDEYMSISSGTRIQFDDVNDRLIEAAKVYRDTDAIIAQRLAELDGALEVPEFPPED